MAVAQNVVGGCLIAAVGAILVEVLLDPLGLWTQDTQQIFVSTAETVTVEEGIGARLYCEPNIAVPDVLHWKDPSEQILISWTNGVVGNERDPIRFIGETGYTLAIKSVRKSDKGRYTCSLVHDGNDPAENSTQLNVENGIVNTESEVKANEGNVVTMQCFFRGEASKVTWRRQHWTTMTDDVVTWQRSGNHGKKMGTCVENRWCDVTKNFSLVLSPAIKSDEATYVCAVSYYEGHKISNTTTLSVKGSTITTKSTETVEKGSKVQLSCKYKAKPYEVRWMKGSMDLVTTSACDIHTYSTYSTMSIYRAKISDGGRYTCRVKYRMDQAQPLESYTDLNVKDVKRDDIVTPQKPKEPEDKELPSWFMPWFYAMFALFLLTSIGALCT